MLAAAVFGISGVSAQTNLVKNGDFSTLNDWTNSNFQYITGNSTEVDVNIIPSYKYFQMVMSVNVHPEAVVPVIPPPLSQSINVQANHTYNLKFLSQGLQFNQEPGIPVTMLAAPPWQVTFGGQTQYSNVGRPFFDAANWVSNSMNFTVGNVTSAVLSFTTSIGSVFSLLHPGCVPCQNTSQDMALSDIRLTDVTPVVAPTLQVQKALGSNRVADTDQFTVQILNGINVVNATTNSTTSGNGATVNPNSGSTGATTLVSGTSYTINEAASGTTKLAQYNSTLSCTDASGANKALALNTVFTLQDDEVISCTLTNTAKAPTLRLTKALGAGGRIDNTDQFTVQILQRFTEVGSGTTTGSGSGISGGTTGWVSLVAGTSYNLAEVMVAGSPSKIGQYDGVVTCTNAWTGSATVVPTTPATPFTPTYGDALDCTITNTAKPVKLTLTQLIISPFPVNLLPPFRFNYSINNGWPVQPQALTTTTLNVPVSTAQQTLAARNVDTTLSTSLPDARWFVSSFACTDSNAASSGNATGNLVRVVASSVTIPAAKVRAGAALKCTLTMGHKVP